MYPGRDPLEFSSSRHGPLGCGAGLHGAQIVISGRREQVLQEACRTLEQDGITAHPVQASTAYLWIVPARAAGSWHLQFEDSREALEIEFAQRFQELSGIAKQSGGGGRTLLQSAHLRGAEIRFAVIDETRRPSLPIQFFGRIFGDTMQGSTGTGRRWRAEKKVH